MKSPRLHLQPDSVCSALIYVGNVCSCLCVCMISAQFTCAQEWEKKAYSKVYLAERLGTEFSAYLMLYTCIYAGRLSSSLTLHLPFAMYSCTTNDCKNTRSRPRNIITVTCARYISSTHTSIHSEMQAHTYFI